MVLDSKAPTRIPWRGSVDVDGRLWPIQDATTVMVPSGKHTLSPGIEKSPVMLLDFNADVRSASVGKDRVELSYSSASRAIAILGSAVSSVEVDGVPLPTLAPLDVKSSVMLPAGQHLVTFVKR
jgi:hypothetical protein